MLIAVLGGCGPPLPDPESPGAKVLVERCGGCHRPYAPQTMTLPMWQYQMERMRGVFAQKGVPWLSPEEEMLLRQYLARYAGGGGGAGS